ncbi:hypothetical protein ACG98H_13560 [Corynebacterium sp. L4756]|uniref:YkvI family membrane protein n=1 Tax=unclassified Corynebacterium TaxID=2624378 RepID=UPI00374DD97C
MPLASPVLTETAKVDAAASSPTGRIKSILLFTGAQCSFLIGAGIATGQESLQYFTAHGWWGMAAIIIVLLLFSWLLSSLTEWGRIHRDDNTDPFVDICGPAIGSVLRACVPVFVFMIAVTMFAGAGALLGDVFNLPTWVGATGMAVVVAITLMFGFRNLVEIIGRIGPLIVVIIGVVALWVVIENFAALADVTTNIEQYPPTKASENWFIGTILYSTAILIIAVPFLTSLGREDCSLKATVRPSILTGLIYGGVMGLCALALLATLPLVYDHATPLVMLGINIAPWLGYVFSGITILGIYSTAAPMLWTVADQFPITSRKTYAIVCLALTAVALVGGMKLPFADLVGFVYPSIGYFGLVFFGILAYRQISARIRGAK